MCAHVQPCSLAVTPLLVDLSAVAWAGAGREDWQAAKEACCDSEVMASKRV